MKQECMLPRFLEAIWNARKSHAAAVTALLLTFAATLVIADPSSHSLTSNSLFRPFKVEGGVVRSATADPTIDRTSKFFDASLGTNGQSCATCHQPEQNFSIHLSVIQNTFEATDGLDPMFSFNDTADRPDADVSTVEARRNAYKLFREMGVVRIGRRLPAVRDYEVEPQHTAQFGPLPNVNDPQAKAGANIPVISAFRRPLVNTNVRFDSAVLWDRREFIDVAHPETMFSLRGQVQKAARTLLLSGGTSAGPLGAVSNADADDVAKFMLNVFTAVDKQNDAGTTHAAGAQGGVDNLLGMGFDPAGPCFPINRAANPTTCTPILEGGTGVHNMTLFDAWADSPAGAADPSTVAGREAVARGQDVFNNAVLIFPAPLAGKPKGFLGRCSTCHQSNNLGNNPNPNFIGRIGTDSIEILTAMASSDPRINALLNRVEKLPRYCLRPKRDAMGNISTTGTIVPFGTAPCGTLDGDQKTTDPGQALTTGHIAQVGRFKPPVLRALLGREPFFHASAAKTLDNVVDFYNARFSIGLTQQQHDDLVAFLKAL